MEVYQQALLQNAGFRKGLNVSTGKMTHKEAAEALNKNYQTAEDAIAA